MFRPMLAASLLALAAGLPAHAAAQDVAVPQVQPINGTRLDVAAVGEVTRVPDVARINAGVVTRAASATQAIQQNATRMGAVRAALRRAGIEDRDIQTSTISLQPDYRHSENQPPQLLGYVASNEVTVRFRDIANTGRILDALVAQGANQLNGPMLEIDRPEAALDEARTVAVTNARARAELYARSLGMRVTRILSVSETGGVRIPYGAMTRSMAAVQDSAAVQIDPGEQKLAVNLLVSFELR